MRQFRSDDTSKWLEGFGNRSAGNKTYTSNHILDSSDGFYNGTFTGTSGASTGNTSITNGTYNLPCKIIQTQGTGATASDNWELNVLISVVSGVANFKYPLTKTYNSGAQILTSNQWDNVTINNSVTISPPAWDGSKGGEIFFACGEKFDNSAGGIIDVSGLTGASAGGSGLGGQGIGFKGGVNDQASTATQGDGTAGIGVSHVSTANSNGGGAAQEVGGPGSTDGAGGGGGGNGVAGTSGTSTGGSNVAGAGGTSTGNVNLTSMNFGGGGGAGEARTGDVGGAGGGGAGNVTIIARTILAGNTKLNGGQGGTGTGGNRCGGGGAGGSVLFKGLIIDLGSTSAVGGTTGTNGGTGGVGRVHVDYGVSVTNESTPTSNKRQDFSYTEGGSLFFSHF